MIFKSSSAIVVEQDLHCRLRSHELPSEPTQSRQMWVDEAEGKTKLKGRPEPATAVFPARD